MAPLILLIFWFRDLRRAAGSGKREDFKVLQDFIFLFPTVLVCSEMEPIFFQVSYELFGLVFSILNRTGSLESLSLHTSQPPETGGNNR